MHVRALLGPSDVFFPLSLEVLCDVELLGEDQLSEEDDSLLGEDEDDSLLGEDQLPEALFPEKEDQLLSEEPLEEDQLPEADEPVDTGTGIGVGRAVGIILAGLTTFGNLIGPPCTCPHQVTSSRLARRKEVLMMCIARCPNSNDKCFRRNNWQCRVRSRANQFLYCSFIGSEKRTTAFEALKGQSPDKPQEILS